MDSSSARYILDLCRSATKRLGGDEPSLTHLAFVLRARKEREFESIFSEKERADLDRMVQARSWVAGEDEVQALLQAVSDEEGILRQLREELLPWFEEQAASTSEPVAEESAESDPSAVAAKALIGRAEICQRVLETFSLRWPRLVVLFAKPGSGRTVVAHQVRELAGEANYVRVIGRPELSPQPDDRFPVLLRDDCVDVYWIDDFELVAGLSGAAMNHQFVQQVSGAVALGKRLVITCDPKYESTLMLINEQLLASAVKLRLPELTPYELEQVVRSEVPALEEAHGVSYSNDCIEAALRPVNEAALRAHPGVALAALDLAGARAQGVGATNVDADLVRQAEVAAPKDVAALGEALGKRVKGQDAAIRAVAKRLALTLARLDLRPERPDGVLLFVGPTGVGKTELAKVLADELFGEGSLIRLDMSEYSHEWATSRITGPMPGYVGSTDPEGWLTTKVAKTPRCVVLLDEIEKAHPTVWNLFLQAFDAGRLTDSRGTTVDLSTAVFVMTTNLGVVEATKSTVGFGAGDAGDISSRIRGIVKDRMPPELLNRMDEIITFQPLTPESIHEIAVAELELIAERLASHGRQVTFDVETLAPLLSSTGYDPTYGARHLQRNIERMLLSAIAEVPVSEGEVQVSASGGAVHVELLGSTDDPGNE